MALPVLRDRRQDSIREPKTVTACPPDEKSQGKAVRTEKLQAGFAAYPAEAYYFAPDDDGERTLEFRNQLESDRSEITRELTVK